MSTMSSWPPKPADTSKTYRACKATGNGDASYERCTSINTIAATRSRYCKGCRCQYRICSSCSEQRVVARDIREIDAATGLCGWHTEFGAAAVRPSPEETGWQSLPSISAVTERTIPDDEEDAASPESGEADEISEEKLAGYASIVLERFSARRMLIMQYLAEGSTRPEIAKRIHAEVGALGNTYIDMARALGVEMNGAAKASKTRRASEILAGVYRYMKEKGLARETEEGLVLSQAFVPTEEQLAEYAEQIARFDSRRRKIIQLIACGTDRMKIAGIMKTSLTAVSVTILKLGRILELPLENIRSTKIEAVTQVLIAAARHPRSTIRIDENGEE